VSVIRAGTPDVRVLFLSPYLPSRVRVRPYSWVRSLVRLGHEVHLVALAPPEDQPASTEDVRRLCTAVDVFPLTRLRTLANAALALPHPNTPLQLAYSHHDQAERRAAALAASGRYDVVHIEHMRGVALGARIEEMPMVLDAVDSISALFAGASRHADSWRTRWLARLDLHRTRRFEARAPFAFSRVVVTSAREATAFVDLAGPAARGRLDVITNGVDTEYFRPAGDIHARAVVFTGKLSYHANAVAAVRLVERIMPVVWATRPDTPVILAGKDPPHHVRTLAHDPRVRVTGYVSDMRDVFRQAAVAICPLVYGAGIQNKVLEALASGVATVMTPVVASALGEPCGRSYLAAESDRDLAEAVLDLLGDPIRRQQLGAEGRAHVVRHHQWDTLAGSLVRVYEVAIAEASCRSSSAY
jgi:polysaccharide biosynthesis protein PslH